MLAIHGKPGLSPTAGRPNTAGPSGLPRAVRSADQPVTRRSTTATTSSSTSTRAPRRRSASAAPSRLGPITNIVTPVPRSVAVRTAEHGTVAVSSAGRYGTSSAMLDSTGCPGTGQVTVACSAITGANGNASAATTPTRPTIPASGVANRGATQRAIDTQGLWSPDGADYATERVRCGHRPSKCFRASRQPHCT
jgi:hypothetical protein